MRGAPPLLSLAGDGPWDGRALAFAPVLVLCRMPSAPLALLFPCGEGAAWDLFPGAALAVALAATSPAGGGDPGSCCRGARPASPALLAPLMPAGLASP